MEERTVWAIRAGFAGQADHVFLDHDQIALSSVEVDDDVSTLPPTRGAFKDRLIESYAVLAPSSIPIHAGQLYRFVHEMRIGDNVIYPRKCDRTLYWGEIAGPYIYDITESAEFAHRRSVRWIRNLSRDLFSQAALYELGSTLTVFQVRSHVDELIRKFETEAGRFGNAPACEDAEDACVRDIAETTIDFISRKLKSELKGYPLELFVADLFRAMGYRARTTRAVRDEGVDIVAHRDELGIEPPILKIQVKAREANVGPDIVKAFYAMIDDRDVGIFITTSGYTAAALDFAKTRGNLKLVGGVELIRLIQKYYDRLDLKYRQQIPLRQVLVPDVELAAAM